MILRTPEAVAQRMLAAVQQTIAGVASDVTDSVKALTPVESGKARDGWIETINNPLNIEVMNDVDYIGVLEYGKEKQEGHAMVRQTLMNAENIINENLP